MKRDQHSVNYGPENKNNIIVLMATGHVNCHLKRHFVEICWKLSLYKQLNIH